MRRDRNIVPRRQRRHVQLPPAERPRQWGMQDVKLHPGRALRRAVEQVVTVGEQSDLMASLAELAQGSLESVAIETAQHERATGAALMQAIHEAAQRRSSNEPLAVNS